jgi:hypothetical protein
VLWVNADVDSTDSLDVVFDDSTVASADSVFLNSGAGNIAPFPGAPIEQFPFAGVRSRQFRRAGTFHWHSARTGISGTVIVQ